jgi:hypothetical protein
MSVQGASARQRFSGLLVSVGGPLAIILVVGVVVLAVVAKIDTDFMGLAVKPISRVALAIVAGIYAVCVVMAFGAMNASIKRSAALALATLATLALVCLTVTFAFVQHTSDELSVRCGSWANARSTLGFVQEIESCHRAVEQAGRATLLAAVASLAAPCAFSYIAVRGLSTRGTGSNRDRYS